MQEQTQQEQTQDQVQQPVQQELPNPFLESSWAGSATEAQEQAFAQSQAPQQQDEYEEEIIDPDEWIKREFNWDNTEAAKAEIEELRQLRESAQTEAEIEFANEQSAKFFMMLQEGTEDEIYSFLENKKKLDRLVSSDIDKSTAAEIIKLSMQQKYKDLTQDEIEYKFRKQFSSPSKPVQQDIETDEEYQDRVSQWEDRVKDIETEMFIEAKLARPELEKYKNELVLPEVEFPGSAKQPTQEELDLQSELMDDYFKSAQDALDSFDGLSVMVKDEEVEIPLSYSVSDEERTMIADKMQRFADTNFDANAILYDRWLNENGTVNSSQMVKDLALLYSEGRVGQKFANDAAAKRLAEYIKRSSNVSISSRTAQNTFNPEGSRTDLDRQIEFIWKNS